MSRYHHNLEPSGFHRGQYVGYGGGKVWRIERVTHAKVWRATTPGFYAIETPTLKELSAKLEAVRG